MIISYAYKRVLRSWKLFLALLLGVVLASAFFSGINIGADSMAKRALDQQLAQTPVDITLNYAYRSGGSVAFPSSENLTTVVDLVKGVERVSSAEVNPMMYVNARVTGIDKQVSFICAGVFDDSRIKAGMTGWLVELGINETLVEADSTYADEIRVGNSISFNITVSTFNASSPYGKYAETRFPVNLTVAGFVSLTDEAYAIATGSSGSIIYKSQTDGGFVTYTTTSGGSVSVVRRGDVLLVSWSTFSKLIDAVYKPSIASSPFQTRVSVFLDRKSLVNPWDVATSLEKVSVVTAKISNKVTTYGFSVSDRVSSALRSYQYTANNMRFGSIVTSLPIFFIAWYMASTVSSVSFNLRRREIGLLLAKGSTRGQLLRIFLSEAFLIGLIGGVVGLGLSFVLSPLFVELGGGVFGGQVVLGVDILVMTTVFGIAITLVAIFQPARKASRLNPVDAVREYTYVEEVRPYKRTLPLTALILGTFKIIILVLGINLQQTVMRTQLGGNIFLMIILAILSFLDGILTYIGPLLFFWGITKVFIQGSVTFQGLATRIMKGFLGDLGSLATRNVRRNPARVASIAFLIALIIGYTIWVNGALASEQDYVRRQVYYNVGCSSMSVGLTSLANTSSSIERVENVSGVSSTTVEYSFSGDSSAGSVRLKAVKPEVWPNIGYYEDEWFIGKNAKDAFQTMAEDNKTIILDRSLGKYLDLKIGDTLTITFGSIDKLICNLRIIGFFGSEQTQQPSYFLEQYSTQKNGLAQPPSYYGSSYWSYVSEDLFKKVNGTVYASARMLVRLKPEANSTAVVKEIRGFDPFLGWVSSVDEMLKGQQGSAELSGIVNIQRLGITFSTLAASIGLGLVTIVSLRERRKELSLINVRGASYKQMIITLLSESLAVVVFAIALGSVVGLIIVHGNVASANAALYSLVKRRIIVSTSFLAMLASNYLLVFASMIIPVVIINRKYMSELGDAIRQG